MENAKKWYDWALTPEAQSIAGNGKISFQVPSNKTATRSAAVAQARRHQAHQLRLRQVRVVGRAQPPADEVGQGGLHAAEVATTLKHAVENHRARAGRLRAGVARSRDGLRDRRRGGVALLVVPWAAAGGPSALLRAIRGAHDMWPLLLGAVVALVCAWREFDRGTAIAAGAAVVWAFGAALAAGHRGAVVRLGRGDRARRADRRVRARDRAARRVRGRSDGGDHRRRHRRAARHLHLLSRSRKSLLAALFDAQGRFAPQLAAQRLLTDDIWGLGCFGGGTRCGVAINSAMLATIVGILSTLLGLVFALVVQRGGRRYSGILKLMSILPIVTPPFVIALALVVLFGRTGLVTGWLDACCGIPRSRWIYGLPGVTHRAAPHVLADRVHDPVRRAVGDQPRAGGGRADVARVAGARVPHGDVAAAASGARQRVPAGLRRKPRRLRQPDRARRQLRRAVDQDLLRRRRRAARPGPRGGARRRAARPHAARVLPAAALDRPAVLRHGDRQGRRRPAGQAAEAACGTRCFSVAGAWIFFTLGVLRRHLHRRLRQGHRPRRHDADVPPLPRRASASTFDTKGSIFTGSAWNSLFTTIAGGGDRGAADRGRRPALRVRHHAPPLRRAPRVRVPDAW